MKEYSMTCIAPTVCSLLGIRSPAQSDNNIIDEIINGIGNQGKMAVIVLDAFGVATWKSFEDLTPNFNLVAHQHLLHVRSVLPSKTPVNFATIATGAPSEVHTIRDRSEPLIVETIFHVVSEASMKSAAVGRMTSTMGILLSKFADYKCVAESNTDEELVRLGIEIIQEKSPEYLIMQILDVDDKGHKFGLESDEIREAVSDVDRRLGDLLPHLAERGYGLMVLADHGAHQSNGRATHDGSVEDDVIVPLAWRGNDYLREIYDLN